MQKKHPTAKEINIPDGTAFGMLTVVARTMNVGRNRCYIVQCECGNIKTMQGRYLRAGKRKSCGCLKAVQYTLDGHRRSLHPLYAVWRNIIHRTTNPKNADYHRVGALGIRVYEPWLVFDKFVADVGPRPPRKMFCRVDTTKDYTPENTVWLTPMQRRALHGGHNDGTTGEV